MQLRIVPCISLPLQNESLKTMRLDDFDPNINVEDQGRGGGSGYGGGSGASSVRVQAGPTSIKVFIDGEEVRAVIEGEVADQIASERDMDNMVDRSAAAYGPRT